MNPDCKEVPPKKVSRVPVWLITVDFSTDKVAWQRQFNFLLKNPDAEYIPRDIIEDFVIVKRRNMKIGRDDKKSGTGYDGAKHIDPRITVRSAEDRVEYRRQTSYLRNHPDCVEIPPRKRKFSNKSKRSKNA